MNLRVEKTDGACGAVVRGLDLTQTLGVEVVAQLRQLWLQHHVLVFPEQELSDDDLERFTLCFGEFGDDPFLPNIEGRANIVELARRADETSSIFADAWHTDWSFKQVPPAGTCLFSLQVPPHGGDTGFINQHRALAEMPAKLRSRLEGKYALHSAKVAYAPDGMYGESDQSSDRTMKIIYSDEANDVQRHPIIRRHPETGEEAIYGCFGYIMAIDDMSKEDSDQLLMDLYLWQTREEFQYSHQWQEKMLVVWDNRSVLHKASGGYEGYARRLHRTTIAERV